MMGDSSSGSTSWSSQRDTQDDRMIALMLSEEYTNLDGAVARRLSNLAPVPVCFWTFLSTASFLQPNAIIQQS